MVQELANTADLAHTHTLSSVLLLIEVFRERSCIRASEKPTTQAMGTLAVIGFGNSG